MYLTLNPSANVAISRRSISTNNYSYDDRQRKQEGDYEIRKRIAHHLSLISVSGVGNVTSAFGERVLGRCHKPFGTVGCEKKRDELR